MVKTMKKNVYVCLALFLLSFSTFTVSAQPPGWNEIIDIGFSDKIVPGTEITWRLKTFETNDPEVENWNIVAGQVLNEGDLFKLNVTEDPDNLGFTHPNDLFFSSESWCDFYLNDVFLTDNITEIDWFNWQQSVGIVVAYIFPITVTFDTGEENFFDYLYNYLDDLDIGDEGSVSAKKTKTTLTVEEHVKIKVELFFGSFTYEYNLKIVFNLEWGVAVLIDMEVKSDDVETRVVLETGIEEIAVPYEWLYGFFAFLLMGLVIIRKKK